MASPPKRTLRSRKRLSLSLNGNHGKSKPKCSSNEESTEIPAVSTGGAIPLHESSIKQGQTLSSDSDALKTNFNADECNIRVRKDLRLSETIVISSDEEIDSWTPSKRSIPAYFTPSKHQNRSHVGSMGNSTTDKKWNITATGTSIKSFGSKTTPRKGISKVRRKICPGSNIKMLTKKYFDDSQKRITNFFNKDADPDRIGYCRVLKESVMPAIITGDIDVESMLSVTVDERTERLRFSQDQSHLGSTTDAYMSPTMIMEQIERVESACYDPIREAWNMEQVPIPIEYKKTHVYEGSVIIPPPHTSGVALNGARIATNSRMEQLCSDEQTVKCVNVTSTNKSSATAKTSHNEITKSSKKKRGKVAVCPPYKIIAGTNFAVDAFRYGDIAGVTHYFLTHFHADHYIGLKKSFSKPLIMSSITARLVKAFINVPEEHYLVVELHQSVYIDSVEIIALDANHCPGALMFLFRLPNGTSILHTGDFRASPEMEEYPEFWNFSIDSIYLDTTYLSSKYAFKSQSDSVTDAREAVATFLRKHIGTKVLIVCGSYLIGKEKVWLELAISTGMKVWTEPNRWKALKAIADPQQLSMLVADPIKANIHVLAMNKLSYDELNEYLNQFPDCYECVIALRPSGWEKNSKPQYRGRINIVGIEYSEHSSFDELKRFVQFIRPRDVISTVPYGNSNQNRTPTVPASWYQGDIRPQRKALQLSITNFIATSKTSIERPSNAESLVPDQLKMEKPIAGSLCEAEPVIDEIIDLESNDDGKAANRSEKGEYSYDSDWLP